MQIKSSNTVESMQKNLKGQNKFTLAHKPYIWTSLAILLPHSYLNENVMDSI